MMRTFGYFLTLEYKRFFSRKNIIILLLFFLLSLYFIHNGIEHRKNINEAKMVFQEIERIKIEKKFAYDSYGAPGFRLLFIPSPLSILFDDSGVFNCLTADIDWADILRIYDSYIGKSLNHNKISGFKDFAGVILLLGSIFALYAGYESLRHKEYLKFLSSLLNHNMVFFSIFFSRIFLFFLYFLFKTGCALLLLRWNGIILAKNEYSLLWLYLFVMIFTLAFFFIVGTIISSFKSKPVSIVTIIFLWFSFIFFIPGILDSIIYNRADNMTSGFRLELEKIKALRGFNRRMIDRRDISANSSGNPTSDWELSEIRRDRDFKVIEMLDKRMEEKMREDEELFQKLSILFPSTFYLSSCDEMSSRGYQNFIDYYNCVQKRENQSGRMYLDHPDASVNRKTKLGLRGDENIFYSKSRLPRYFTAGLILTGFYIILLLFISYSRFKQTLFFSNKKEIPRLDELEIKLENGKCTVCVTSSQQIRDLVFGFFSKKDRDFFTGKIEIDGKEMNSGSGSRDFVYLCHQDHFPGDIKGNDFLSFCGRILGVPAPEIAEIKKKLNLAENGRKNFAKLSDITKGDILFSAARLKKSKLYLIDEIEKGMSQTYTNRLLVNLQELKKGKVAILYLSSNLYFAAKVSERMIVPGDERIENILK